MMLKTSDLGSKQSFRTHQSGRSISGSGQWIRESRHKAISFKHNIKDLRKKILTFNRVELKGFRDYQEFNEKVDKMVEEAIKNKKQRDIKRGKITLSVVKHAKTERRGKGSKINEVRNLKKRLTKTIMR
ncbi:unnamed protein product [Moneuplotes crassus]|uniref:Uncharacterized protein n=1 Tax=Euplotes crassus TaxID=5936 RepID=A0AAD1XNW9_EUPCR|nr:unnamed protein product [Moneuplotes crassus]